MTEPVVPSARHSPDQPEAVSDPAEPVLGEVVELTIGAVAHGGHCVARLGDDPHGRVVFVRHCLPGERARVQITEVGSGSFLRGDAVEILHPAEHRVAAPCPHAGAGRCGGCDWQHVSAGGQRALKTAVVREQFRRLAQLDVDCEVEELPGGLLGWRTRVLYAVAAEGKVGLRHHRSHRLEAIDACPLGVPGVADAEELTGRWPGLSGLEVVAAADDGTDGVTVLGHRPARPSRPASGARGRGRGTLAQPGRTQRRTPDRVELQRGPAQVRHRVHDRDFAVAAGGFWQVHPAAAPTFVSAMLTALAPQPGERVLDLYAGAGLFTAFLADAVGAEGDVVGVESDVQAVRDAQENLRALPQASVVVARVTGDVVREQGERRDLVILDPPRSGVGREVMLAVLDLAPRAIGYLACDPASLARDVATALAGGWRLDELRAFDAFPMTHHVETLAVLRPPVPPVPAEVASLP